MPYTKTVWEDEIPASTPIKYKITETVDGDITADAKIELVTSVTPGTPVNATNLNKMETGIETAQATAEDATTDAAAAQATADAAVPKNLVTAIGQLIYSTASGVVAALAKPAVRAFLQNTSAGALSWETLFGIHAKALKIYDAGVQDVTSTSYVDVTNGSQTIVTTKTCTILMIATGCYGCDNPARTALARPMINGSAPASDAGSAQLQSTGSGFFPFTVLHYVTGVAAGTITCKLQGKISATTGHVYFSAGTILLIAIEE